MPEVAALLDSRAALTTLRRGLAPPRSPFAVVGCRGPAAVERHCRQRLLDAVVLGRRGIREIDLDQLRLRFPGIPVIGYAGFRPNDGEQLWGHLASGRLRAIAVDGVDDPVLGDLVVRAGASRARADALRAAPRLLRLSDPIQLRIWHLLVQVAGRPVSTTEVARQAGISREHLSRQFGAGAAPNLKRVIDLLRIVCAAELLLNPGHDARSTSAALRFSSPSHLGAMARRITGAPASRLAALGPEGVLRAFARAGTRSRA